MRWCVGLRTPVMHAQMHVRVLHVKCPVWFPDFNCNKFGYALTQLVEEVRCKQEIASSVSRFCHWNPSMTSTFRPHYDPGVGSASNRNECQECNLGSKGGWDLGMTILPPSCADRNLGASASWNLLGIYMDCFNFYHNKLLKRFS